MKQCKIFHMNENFFNSGGRKGIIHCYEEQKMVRWGNSSVKSILLPLWALKTMLKAENKASFWQGTGQTSSHNSWLKGTALGRLKPTPFLLMWSTNFKQSMNMLRVIKAINPGSCARQRGKISGALTAVSCTGIAAERLLCRTSLKGC